MQTNSDSCQEQQGGLPRWVVAALLSTLMMLLAGGAWFYAVQERELKQQAEDDLVAVARFKVDQIERWKRGCIGDATVIMDSPFLAQGIEHFLKGPNAVNGRDLRARLQSLKTNYLYSDVLLVDAEGKTRLSLSGHDDVHLNLDHTLERASAERKPVFTDIHIDPEDDDPHISFIAPVFANRDLEHHFLGAVVLKMPASLFLYPLLQTWPTHSETAETLLVRREGDRGLFLNKLRHPLETTLKKFFPLTRADAPAVMAIGGARGLVRGKDYRGHDVLAYLTGIPGTQWLMVSKMDVDEVYSAWRRQSLFIFALFACVLAGLGGTALLLWQRKQKEYFQAQFLTETRLRESMELQSITLSSIGDGVIGTDAQGLVTLLNPVAERLTGWSLEKARGKMFDEVFRIIHEETRQPVENQVARVLAEGITLALANHTVLIAADGSELPIADSAAPIRNDCGDIIGVVLVFRDCSAESKIQQAQEALQQSERALRFTLDGLSAHIAILDDQGTILLTNKAWQNFAEQNGTTAQTVSDGVNYLRVCDMASGNDAQEAPRFAEGIRSVLDGKSTSFTMEYPCDSKTETRWFVGRATLFPEDVPRRVIVAHEDITERKQAEEELRKRWQIMEQTPACIVITNSGGNIEYVNPYFSQLTSYSAEEAIGQNPRILKSGLHDEAFYRDLWATISSGKIWRGEICNRKKDGTTYWEDATISPVTDANGQITHYIAVKEDVTSKRELEELKEDMERITRHDLKSPLTGILGLPQLLMDDENLTAEQRDYLQMIIDSGFKMLNMINLSLDLIRMEQGTYELEATPVNMLLAVRQVIVHLDPLARSRDIAVHLLFDGRPASEHDHCMGKGEELLCYSILSNLLKNALESSPKGVGVTIDMHSGDGCSITIRNVGEVPPEFQARFFEKYATFGKRKGTGLGTYSARIMAKAMGGDIALDTSEPGATTVTVRLPHTTDHSVN